MKSLLDVYDKNGCLVWNKVKCYHQIIKLLKLINFDACVVKYRHNNLFILSNPQSEPVPLIQRKTSLWDNFLACPNLALIRPFNCSQRQLWLAAIEILDTINLLWSNQNIITNNLNNPGARPEVGELVLVHAVHDGEDLGGLGQLFYSICLIL